MDDEKLNRQVESQLRQFDRVDRAKAPEFFYTRLEARMERQKKVDGLSLSWSLATMMLLLLINFMYWFNTGAEVFDDNVEEIELMASEYESGEYMFNEEDYEE